MRTITLIPGDGIGPSVTDATVRVIEATGLDITWELALAGATALKEKGSPLPQETLDSITRNKIALKGPCDTPIGGGFASVNVALRKEFDLYSNLRPIKSMPGVKSRYYNVDLVVFREGIEDIYGGEGYYLDDSNNRVIEKTHTAMLTGKITWDNCFRYFMSVFDYAVKHNRKRVTIVHKANIVKEAYGMFLEVGLEFAKICRDIKVDERIIDHMAMRLVMNPNEFDIIALPNMFGDIISEECAGLIGGLGLVPGANIGSGYAIFEAAHGTAPDIAGKNLANPTAVILSGAMMLDHIGEIRAACTIRQAVSDVIAEGKNVTKDLNPAGVGTIEMTDAIIERMGKWSDYYFA